MEGPCVHRKEDELMTKAFIITLSDNPDSVTAGRILIDSIKETGSKLEPEIFEATTPDTIREGLKEITFIDGKSLKWTYPTSEERDGLDLKTGLYLRHYRTDNPMKTMACTVSHMRLWQKCIDLHETIAVLEHDSIFTRKFSYVDIPYELKPKRIMINPVIIGLNDPRGATRKAGDYHEKVKASRPVATRRGDSLHKTPVVDDAPGDKPLPSGLAGNSAYLINKYAARALLSKTEEVGLWPNDALMCRQFFPWLRVVYPYHTKVQGLKSTTTS